MDLDRASQGDERFAQFAIIWTIRNRARGLAGRLNVEREFSSALSPVATRIGLGALEEIMRLLSEDGAKPIHVHPVPCRMISVDEHRIVLVCRAILASNGACATQVAAELVGPARADDLVGHIHTLLIAVLDRKPLPGATQRGGSAVSLNLH